MRLSFRELLRTSSLSAVSAALVLSATVDGIAQKQTPREGATSIQRSSDLPIEVQKDPVFLFKPETFKPYVGSIFTAPSALGQKIELKLVDVSVFTDSDERGIKLALPKTEGFSLTFRAAAELPRFTSIHKISHPSLGTFELFLTKCKSDNGDLLYDAVINHLL